MGNVGTEDDVDDNRFGDRLGAGWAQGRFVCVGHVVSASRSVTHAGSGPRFAEEALRATVALGTAVARSLGASAR